nr:FtsQ-type POTRA domain-containing protein [Brevibacterium antiquum]
MALDKVSVKGSELVDHEQVSKSVLDTEGGTPLPRVRPGAVEKNILKEFPRAKEASVHYSGPRSLSIEITDRDPVLAITTTSGFKLFDDEAVNLGTVKKAPKGVTVLEESGGAPDQKTVAAVIRFMAELRPQVRSDLASIHAKDENNIAGVIDTGKAKAKVVFGDSTNASLKMRTALQLAADGRTDIDVSVPSVPVTN